jgi:hypothetical protein
MENKVSSVVFLSNNTILSQLNDEPASMTYRERSLLGYWLSKVTLINNDYKVLIYSAACRNNLSQ